MKIGDKVVCVDDSLCRCGCGFPIPCKKELVYVVKLVREGKFKSNKKGLVVELIGVSSPYHMAGIASKRFRLLDELKQQARETNAQKRLHL